MDEDTRIDGKLVRMARRPWDNSLFADPKDCLSTHGASGYAPGSYLLGDNIVCDICGLVIEHKGKKPSYIVGVG